MGHQGVFGCNGERRYRQGVRRAHKETAMKPNNPKREETRGREEEETNNKKTRMSSKKCDKGGGKG